MNDQVTDLCCCEYFDNKNERNHILACCCNCYDLDEGFECIITGRNIPEHHKAGLMATILDRLRIPWRGGARQVTFDAILPIILLPITFRLAAISFWWTVFSFTAVTVILLSVFKFFICTIPRTKFFFIWTITSIVILYVIFEFVVIPFLQILFEENITLSILIGVFLLCLYLMRIRSAQLQNIGESEAEKGTVGVAFNRCAICQIGVPDRDHHCVWFDCCVGRHNQCLFILTLLFGIAALVYSSNLTLTSVCHPFIFYKTILLPDDCSDVYQQFEFIKVQKFSVLVHVEWCNNNTNQLYQYFNANFDDRLALAFVSALYSLALALILLVIFLQQLILVSLGLTTKDWRNMSLLSKCFLGIFAKRPHSLGFFKNWSRIICWNRNYYGAVNQMR